MDPVRAKAERARAAALSLQRTDDAARQRAVRFMADALTARASDILSANETDVTLAEKVGVAPPLLSRLKLTPEKLALTLDGIRQVASLPDPIGRTVAGTRLDDGLRLFQVTVPLGVIACVFESRPDAAIQIPALALRSANAVLLKGGAEAERTNAVIVDVVREAVARAGLPQDAVQLLAGRAEVAEVLRHDDLVDLVIPRGGSAFVRHVMDNTRIPVLGHAEGVCHVFLDASANPAKAIPLCVDAKTDYPAACNAAECFLVHHDAAPTLVPLLVAGLREAGVEVRATAEAARHAPAGSVKAAAAADFGCEFGALVASLDIVGNVDEAAAFINRHGSRHTEVIVTEDRAAARRFVASVDAAGVYVNASPRFADGYRYGLGAEVGISTAKIHARGPVGLSGLTTTKWILLGDGHRAADYQGDAPRRFHHAPLRETAREALGGDGA